jgi:hypothetical protein
MANIVFSWKSDGFSISSTSSQEVTYIVRWSSVENIDDWSPVNNKWNLVCSCFASFWSIPYANSTRGTSFPRLQGVPPNRGWRSAQGVNQLSRRAMRIGIGLSGNNCGKTFIGLSSGASSRAEVCFPPPRSSRECTLPITISETGYDLNPSHKFLSEQFAGWGEGRGDYYPPNVPGIRCQRRSFCNHKWRTWRSFSYHLFSEHPTHFEHRICSPWNKSRMTGTMRQNESRCHHSSVYLAKWWVLVQINIFFNRLSSALQIVPLGLEFHSSHSDWSDSSFLKTSLLGTSPPKLS